MARSHLSPAVREVLAPLFATAGLTVLHYDADDDRISGLTGQPVRWVVPRGTVD